MKFMHDADRICSKDYQRCRTPGTDGLIRILIHIIHTCSANRPGTRRNRVFERILLPTCLPAGRYSGSMFLWYQEAKASERSENVLPGGFAEAKARILYAVLCDNDV